MYMYIRHGMALTCHFPPFLFGTTLKGSSPPPARGSSPYDPEIWSTLDGTKGFRRSSGKGGKVEAKTGLAMENPTRISNMGVSKNRCTRKSSHFNRVFHDFHHPFWGTVPIFGNTQYTSTSKMVGIFSMFYVKCKNLRYPSLYLRNLQNNPEV